jgi:hypothetical protein
MEGFVFIEAGEDQEVLLKALELSVGVDMGLGEFCGGCRWRS